MTNQALVVIDVQNIFFKDANNPLHKGGEVVEHINKLIEKARKSSVPIIFVRHQADYMKKGTFEWEIYAPIDTRETDFFIEKKTPDSFYETGLQQLLEREKIGEIFLCGFQTDFCVDTTCRSAFGKKIKAFLIEDAHSTFDTEFIKAEQIIEHHNRIIGSWFAELVPADKVKFQTNAD